jgi:hypothetical protein
VIQDLGGEISTTSAAWQTFVDAMAAASTQIPDYSSLISQLA